MDNADPQNFSSKLSPDVEPFVPRQYQYTAASTSQETCNTVLYSSQSVPDIPPYITNCYPFVQEEYIGYDYNIQSQWVNNYIPNVTVQPHYTSMQIPLSPVYPPFQYSQPCYTYISKSKPASQLRNKQQNYSSVQQNRRNYSNVTDSTTLHKADNAVGITHTPMCDGKQNKYPERQAYPPRNEHQVSYSKINQAKKSNKSSKDRQKETFTQDVKKLPHPPPPLSEGNNSSNEQSGGKGGTHSGTIQLQSGSGSRYHNRTLGDFILNVKIPKKNKPTSTTQVKTENAAPKKKPQCSKPTKKVLQGALPNGFEIRNSDWPTAGEMKTNQSKDQHRSLFGTDLASNKPKSFADIIKSSPSKNPNLSLSQTRNLLQFSWSLDVPTCDANRELYQTDDDSRAKLLTHFIHTKSTSDSTEKNSKTDYEESSNETDQSSKCINQALPSFGHVNIVSSLTNSKSNCDETHKLTNCSNQAQSEVPYLQQLSATSNERTGASHIPFSRHYWKANKKESTGNSATQPKKESAENSVQKSNSTSPAHKTSPASNTASEKSCSSANACESEHHKENFSRTPRRPKSVGSPARQSPSSANSPKENVKHGKENSSSVASTNNVSCDKSPSIADKIAQSIHKSFSKNITSCSDRTSNKCAEEKTNSANSEPCINGQQRETNKKKKKRKSASEKAQLKKTQLAAMQGKMVFLTPDMYSKLVSTNANISESKQKENLAPKTSVDEYPVLGNNNDLAKKNIPVKMTDADKLMCDEDPEWSDIDSDYESSGGVYPAGNVSEQSRKIHQTCWTNSSRCANVPIPLGLSYRAALTGQSAAFDCSASKSEQENQIINTNCEVNSKKLKKKKSPSRSTSIDVNETETRQRKNKLVKPKPNEPIQLDISQMINFSEVKRKVKKQKFSYSLSTKGAGKDLKSGKGYPVIANILDSTAPSRRRGKERETPAKKQPSALKKIILKEREERRHLRQLEEEKRKRLLSGSSLSDNDGNTSQDSAWETQGSASSATPSIADGEEEKETDSLPILAKSLMHSRRFREYCNHMLKPEIDNAVTQLLQDLIRFHNRLYHKDPLKAKARRRIVLGLREVTKHLKLKKLKCLILAPNLDRIKSKGGLDDAIENILALAREQNIPYIFALGRKPLGKVCYKQVPVSCVGIFSYAGSEKNFRRLMDLVDEAQKEYLKLLQVMEKDLDPAHTSSADNITLVAMSSENSLPQQDSVATTSSSQAQECTGPSASSAFLPNSIPADDDQ